MFNEIENALKSYRNEHVPNRNEHRLTKTLKMLQRPAAHGCSNRLPPVHSFQPPAVRPASPLPNNWGHRKHPGSLIAGSGNTNGREEQRSIWRKNLQETMVFTCFYHQIYVFPVDVPPFTNPMKMISAQETLKVPSGFQVCFQDQQAFKARDGMTSVGFPFLHSSSTSISSESRRQDLTNLITLPAAGQTKIKALN